MIVGVAIAEIHIPHAQSLKSKRSVVRSLKDHLRNRLRVSVAEVGMNDLHQRARIGISFVCSDPKKVESIFESIASVIDEDGDAVLSGWTTETLDFDPEVNLGVFGFSLGDQQ